MYIAVIGLIIAVASTALVAIPPLLLRVEFNDVGIKISRRKRRPRVQSDWTMDAKYFRAVAGAHLVGFFDEAGDLVFYRFHDPYRADAVANWLSAGAADLRSLDEVLADADWKREESSELETFVPRTLMSRRRISLAPRPSLAASALRDAYLAVAPPPNPIISRKRPQY